LENYVNSHYLGRQDIPVETGYINNLMTETGNFDSVRVTGQYNDYTGTPIDRTITINSEKILLYNNTEYYLGGYTTIDNRSGIYSRTNDNHGAHTWNYDIHASGVNLENSQLNGDIGILHIIPTSGIHLSTFDYDGGYEGKTVFNASPIGLTFSYIDNANATYNNDVIMEVDPSGAYYNVSNVDVINFYTPSFNIVGGGGITAGYVRSSGPLSLAVPTTVSSTPYTMQALDATLIFAYNGSTNYVTLLAASSCPGRILNVKAAGAPYVVSNASDVVPLAGGAAGTAILDAVTPGPLWATLQSDGNDWIIIAQGEID
jgi:hypothetical protein